MNYSEALEFIHTRERFSSLDSMRELCALLGNPQKKLKFVHISGTNGKGSINAYISTGLKLAGCKTGTFISPYIYDFCERIQIDGVPIPQEDLCRLTEKIAGIKSSVSEFELVTAIGFCYFLEQKCDYVVMEVGLGGRGDQTNVIDCPEVACIAMIDFDHMAILGSTIEQIAFEKCGIIKGGSVVSYPCQHEKARAVIEQVCHDTGSTLYISDLPEICSITLEKTVFRYKNREYAISMHGKHQAYNAVVAIDALKLLGVRDEFILNGLEETHFAGRFEVIRKNPYVIIDGGHNVSGMQTVADAVKLYFGRVNMVMGMASDKEWKKCVGIIAPFVNKMVLTKPDTPRSWNLDEARAEAEKYCKNVVVREKIEDAVDEAMGDLPVIIGGSLFLIGKAAKYVRICM